jgi:hypothetical protein
VLSLKDDHAARMSTEPAHLINRLGLSRLERLVLLRHILHLERPL